MNAWKRVSAACLCLVCAGMFLTGCGKTAKQQQNIAEEDMPYGSTMRENKSAFAIPLTYDRRFVDDDMAAAAADLYAAIQNQDAALYQASTFDYYASYQQDKVYKAGSMDEVMQKLHASIAQDTAEDFEFKMVLLNDVDTNMEAGELGDISKMLGALYTGDTNFHDSVEDAWDFTVEFNLAYENQSKFLTVEDQHLFMFKTKDGYFCVV